MSEISYKKYKCKNCGHIKDIQTNHYGECYGSKFIGNTCPNCSWKNPLDAVVWECQETPPEGEIIPEKWQTVKLGDIIKSKKGKQVK